MIGSGREAGEAGWAQAQVVPAPLSPLQLHAWSGGRPVAWVRAGAALAAAGYGIVAASHLVSGMPPLIERVFELGVAVTAAVAFLLAGRRAALASGLILASMAAEALASLPAVIDLGTSAFLVLVALVVLSGLLLGERAVVVATVSVLVLVPATLALFGRFGHRLEGLSQRDSSRLLVFELVVGGLGAMTWFAFRTFERVRAAAEERYALEARLWHLQRLEIVGVMASGLAHQLKNVLAVAQGTAELLEDHADPGVRVASANLLEAAGRGSEWVRQLLGMARRDEPRGEEIDLVQWLERFGRLGIRLLGYERRFDLRLSGPAPAWLDAAHLEQVVLNLLTNARDATARHGTVVLAARSLDHAEAAALGSTLAARAQVLLEVSDDGPGVAPEVMVRLFEPFVTSKPRGQGTGLGLATVRSIAEAWKGCVIARSAPGAGATFRVFLPRAGTAGGP